MTSVDQNELEAFRALIVDRLGIRTDETHMDQLAELLEERLHHTRLQVTQYLRHADAEPSELRIIIERLTVGETYFFRNPDQFRAFANVALPDRMRAREAERCLRILSAGCASGEEPYTLAMLTDEQLALQQGWKTEILGIDLNPSFLGKARQARYSDWSLRGVPEHVRQRYFSGSEQGYVLRPAIQRMVHFEERNLHADDANFWQPGRFDIIFCRNVFIYLSPEAIECLIARFTRALAPGGYLFLGPAETLRGLSRDFHLCHSHESFYYQRKEQGVTDIEIQRPHRPIELSVGDEATWVDAIRRSSERIARLASPMAESPPVPEIPTLELGPVLELFRQERFAEALELLRRHPSGEGDPDSLLLEAATLVNLGDMERAESVCGAILATDEFSAGAHYLLALCREHSGDVEAAKNQDEMAVYLDPQFAMPHLHLGRLARRSGDPLRARRAIAQALYLLAREDAARILLFGGGFGREALQSLCRGELRNLGDEA